MRLFFFPTLLRAYQVAGIERLIGQVPREVQLQQGADQAGVDVDDLSNHDDEGHDPNKFPAPPALLNSMRRRTCSDNCDSSRCRTTQ